jgi:hypothetical protein
MKWKYALLGMLLMTTLTCNACSCTWGGNFLRAAFDNDLVVKAKVTEQIFIVEGDRFATEALAISHAASRNYEHYHIQVAIKIEVLEIIKGDPNKKSVEIMGTNGGDCLENVRRFAINDVYIFALSKSADGMYVMGACSENWLHYSTETNEVTGKIKGTSIKRKNRSLSYGKLRILLI